VRPGLVGVVWAEIFSFALVLAKQGCGLLLELARERMIAGVAELSTYFLEGFSTRSLLHPSGPTGTLAALPHAGFG
jgi:hypothetical protein